MTILIIAGGDLEQKTGYQGHQRKSRLTFPLFFGMLDTPNGGDSRRDSEGREEVGREGEGEGERKTEGKGFLEVSKC